ncbi:hypothetical protein [Cellvibrio sp. OA-2007]|uniref:hypothetical protein n=1 Tax=Cellvibrio sp. OA-2007 TaxID=529823 RepID=UPI0007822B8F|nr:hypothetical protein [Cellvibrio sp. OA-2007]
MKLSDDSGSQSAANPFHTSKATSSLVGDSPSAFGTLKEGLEHEVDDLVKLELTAEQMLGEEVDLAKAYINDDIHGVWAEISGGLSQWELITGKWLLSAADPTRVDWQLHHWWGDEESQFRH